MIDVTLRGNDELERDMAAAKGQFVTGVDDLMIDLAGDAAKEARRRASKNSVSGRARDSINSRGPIISAGSGIPYYNFADFGGRVGIRKSVKRQFIKGGRWLFPAIRNVGVYKKAYAMVEQSTKGVQ